MGPKSTNFVKNKEPRACIIPELFVYFNVGQHVGKILGFRHVGCFGSLLQSVNVFWGQFVKTLNFKIFEYSFRVYFLSWTKRII